jgi:hypothetical protein
MTTSKPGRTRGGWFTPKTFSFATAAAVTVLLAIRIAPNVAYRLQLPLWVFYALLISTLVLGFVLQRRWRRHLPKDEEPDLEQLKALSLWRVRLILLGPIAFRVVPILAAMGVVTWFIFHFSKPWVYGAIGFAFVWSLVAQPLWNISFLPLLRRNHGWHHRGLPVK